MSNFLSEFMYNMFLKQLLVTAKPMDFQKIVFV